MEVAQSPPAAIMFAECLTMAHTCQSAIESLGEGRMTHAAIGIAVMSTIDTRSD